MKGKLNFLKEAIEIKKAPCSHSYRPDALELNGLDSLD